MKARHYQEPEDFYRAQAALMAWVAERGHCNYLHKGDIGHRLFSGNSRYDPADVMRLWLDESGEIHAFAVLDLPWDAFDLQVAPSLWLSDLHIEIFDCCERETLRLSERNGKSVKEIVIEVDSCDPAYRAFVEARGYQFAKHSLSLTRHDLERLPGAELPAGFRFQDAEAEDAARLADVHNHSFTNKWSAESYGRVFQSPHMEREIVVVAPDGRFAAFTNIWIDDVNRSLLFEPVGTHSDFRRRGLGKALMAHVLKRMRAERGIICAYVCHEPAAENPASAALYASVGFKKVHEIHDYKKSVLPPASRRGEAVTRPHAASIS